MKSKKRGKKKFSIQEEYKKGLEYVKESRNFIYIIISLFFLFALVGFFIPVPEEIYNTLINYIQGILKETENMSHLDLIGFITFNNIQSTFFGITLGILMGIFPLMSTVVNGYMIGFVSSMSVASGGIFTLWKLFPHGIFELPAVFISLGLGLKLGMFLFQKNKFKSLKEYAINSIRVFLLIVIPLLIIAGIIEGTLIALSR